jgi:hypothetical protein
MACGAWHLSAIVTWHDGDEVISSLEFPVVFLGRLTVTVRPVVGRQAACLCSGMLGGTLVFVGPYI